MLGRLLTGKLPVQGHIIVVVDEGEEKKKKKTNRKEKREMRREGKGEWKYARRRGESRCILQRWGLVENPIG